MKPRLLLLLLLTFLAVACSRAPQKDAPLRVGMELNFPPFEVKTPDGTPSGVSVELAQELGVFLGRKVAIVDMPFDALIPSLKTDKIDLIISSMTSTPERAKSIDFSDPYVSTGLAILAGKNTNIQSVADLDLSERRIAVKKGTTAHIYVSQNLKKTQPLVFDKDGTAVLEVAQGKADAFIYDQMSILQHSLRNPDTTRALLAPFQKESWAIGIRKGNDPLRNDVNRFLADFKARKGFDALGDKYCGEHKKAFAALGIPFYF